MSNYFKASVFSLASCSIISCFLSATDFALYNLCI
uniref:Lipoprotein n=1 Tax=Brassica oleracea TaxID=3712 RepID=A0A3P6EJZ1_BRAOL|nr:unnamed protein product [Brassica oleracea]